MMTVADNSATIAETQAETPVSFPLGLLGFEAYKHFVLIHSPEEEPFGWLQVPEDSRLAFLVLSPFCVVPDYQAEISEEDARFLGLKSPGDALIYNIVTLRPGAPATINLKGPIVINRETMVGRQVVLVNAAAYAVQHPLPADDSN
ncbi:MAG TPA: flagellar assembly protein FliW [Candidatus Limnocylindria bacterium]|jgi:flagellar assembly factor FliW|nr:flagellar assembly protein FliW [Candidatus Limnocylindria bacterium]